MIAEISMDKIKKSLGLAEAKLDKSFTFLFPLR